METSGFKRKRLPTIPFSKEPSRDNSAHYKIFQVFMFQCHRKNFLGLPKVDQSALSLRLLQFVLYLGSLSILLFSNGLRAQPAAVPEAEDSDNWLQEMTVKVREYRNLYQNTREAYNTLRENYESMQETHRNLTQRILQYQTNIENSRLFLQSEREAWQSLYRNPHRKIDESSSGETPQESFPWYLRIPFFTAEPATEQNKQKGVWERIRYRYQFYKTRYEEVQKAYQTLQEGTEKLVKENQRLEDQLNHLRNTSDDPYLEWAKEREAWGRLYRE